MKKNFIFWLVLSIIIMLLLPWLTVHFISDDAGMAVCLILFFIVNPIYSIFIGIFAGKDIKDLWSLPIILPTLYLFSAWILFDMGEKAFILYAGIYLFLGEVAMLISKFINQKTPIRNLHQRGSRGDR